jgi:hypothetical protein
MLGLRLLLVALLIVGAAEGASLVRDWKRGRDTPLRSKLYSSCTLSPDSTTINGLICNSNIAWVEQGQDIVINTATLRIGCLAPPNNRAYKCSADTGRWALL